MINIIICILNVIIIFNTTRKLINTNGNTEGITVGKKLKQSKKKRFLPTELPTEFISSVIPLVNLSVNCEHYSSCQL
jgi:hypothetical protein